MNNLSLDIKKEKTNLRKWTRDATTIELMSRKPLAEIRAYLIYLRPAITISLERLYTWEGVRACLDLLEGETAGWIGVQRSYQFLAWSRRIYVAYLDTKHFKSMSLSATALPLAHAIATKDDGFAVFLGNRLTASFNAGGKPFTSWELTPFEPFMVKLYALWQQIPLDSTKTKVCVLGVYQEVLDAWHDEARFAKALHAACDYHLGRNDDPNDDGFPEFQSALYALFPVEILAIKRIREDQGLPMPEIGHPLMQTPLAHPPAVMPKVEDELLEQVIAKVRSELPIGDPW